MKNQKLSTWLYCIYLLAFAIEVSAQVGILTDSLYALWGDRYVFFVYILFAVIPVLLLAAFVAYIAEKEHTTEERLLHRICWGIVWAWVLWWAVWLNWLNNLLMYGPQ